MGNPNQSERMAETSGASAGLGGELRRAREARGFSVTTAAATLHLAPKVIESLEAGDFKLYAPVYVRGYLRNYARLLGLKPDSLIETYNQTLPEEPSAVLEPALPPGKPPVRWHGYLLLAAIGLPLILWLADRTLPLWKTQRSPETEAGTLGLPAAPTGEAPQTQPLAPSLPAPNPAPEPPKPSVSDVSVSAAPLPAAAPDKTEPAAQAPAAKPADPSPQPTGQGPDTLSIRLPASAWVSIRDHAGHKLAHENLSAETEHVYQGQAPFAVVLGNYSPATKIEFNGQPYEPTKAKAGTVARFNVGAGATKP